MDLSWLHVLHQPKGGSPDDGARMLPVIPGGLVIDTCQRSLCVVHTPDAPVFAAGEVFSGVDAYRFLLRVAAGLESRIAGETDVFGQVKTAWKRQSCQTCGLSPWMQKLFEDTKDIRSRYLQNVGGASYGSLVRLLLKQLGAADGPTALLGAGQLARTVAPFLAEGELRLWNRTAEGAAQLLEAIAVKAGSRVQTVTGDEWAASTNVAAVLCIPTGAEEDARRIALWRAGGADRPLLHLGLIGGQRGAWGELPRLHTLEDIFALQRSQSEARAAQLERASQACEEKASLRASPLPVSRRTAANSRVAFA